MSAFVPASSLGVATPFTPHGSRGATSNTGAASSSSSSFSLQFQGTNQSSDGVGSRPPSDPLSPTPLPAYSRGRVCFGNCGWTDRGAPWNTATTAAASARLAGPGSSSSLHAYAHRYHGCVEVDSTTYNYPLPSTVQNWVASTPTNFVFHIKLFGFLCSRGGQRRSLPRVVQEMLPPRLLRDDADGWVRMKEIPNDAVNALWRMSNDMLGPLIAANKLGVVLLQFHTSFSVSQYNRGYIRYCRRMLRSDARMAVEFRDRAWIVSPSECDRTVQFLSSLPAALVASGDLKHELAGEELKAGEAPVRLNPVVRITPGLPQLMYCRVHRRRGAKRLLSDDALNDWIARLKAVIQMGGGEEHEQEQEQEEKDISAAASPSATPHRDQQLRQTRPTVYFLWGTDHKDQQLLNARKMQKMLPPRLRCNWHAQVRQAATSKKGSLLNMLLSNDRPPSSSSLSAAGPEVVAAAPPSLVSPPPVGLGRANSIFSSSSNSSKPFSSNNKKSRLMSFVSATPCTQTASSGSGGGEKRRKKKKFLYSSADRDSGFAGSHKHAKMSKSCDRGISSFFVPI
jgi:uncharacterized protein YecE (DUF72 family)